MKSLKSIFWILLIIGIYQGGRYLYFKPNVDSGEIAGDFPINENLNLSDLKGNFVLLDFWGSWCGPCIREFPEVKKLYSELNGKQFKSGGSFEVVGIAVEDNENRWKRAIDRFELNWKYQVLDKATNLRFFNSPIAGQYGVKEVPAKFLINPQGEIIGVNLPFNEIRNILDDQLIE